MSTWRERLDQAGAPGVMMGWLVDNYHYPVLLGLVVVGFVFRILNWRRFVVDGTILYRGNDPFYHLRSVQYVVEHWPATMPFDPWTNFPTGTSVSQFGTLFDQLIATAALVLGLGDPSPELVRLVLLFAPAVFGIAVVVPTYVIGRRLGGKFGGVVAAGVVALAASDLLVQSSVGSSDHHVAEVLFQALAVLGVMVAVSAAESEKPVYELLADREFATIRSTLAWGLLAGIGIGAYLSVWPPGVLLLGILGVFFVVHLSAIYVRGRSPEHVAIAGAVALGTAGVISLSTVTTLGISATTHSLLQPGLAFGVAVGCGFMAWLARTWEERDLPTTAYPAAVFATGLALAAALALLSPDIFEYLRSNVGRVIGFQITEIGGTVGEIQPLRDPGRLYSSYKLAVLTAIAGGVAVVLEHVTDRDPRAERLLIVVWVIFMTAASFTQRRFLYYMAVPVAALSAVLVGEVVAWVDRTSTEDGIESFQLLTVATVILVVLAPLVLFAPTAVDAASGRGPAGVTGWQSSLEWMDDNTPVPGQYARPDGDAMAYLGTFERTADFDYPAGAYGVLSWWDYGHWITASGQRIPNANPFQQGTDTAARFLLAQNESTAEELLASTDEADATTRYVMVDWKMVETESAGGGKFFAPPAFVDGVENSDYYSRIVDGDALEQSGNLIRATNLVRHKPAYYRSMAVRLYHYHGSAAEPRPVVLSWQGEEQPYTGGTFTVAPSQQNAQNRGLRVFQSLSQAEEYVEQAPGTRQVGGIGANPTERIPALEHYRLVDLGNYSALQGAFSSVRLRAVSRTNLASELGYPANRSGRIRAINWLLRTSPTWTKTFERVPGATIEGTGPPNATVTASIALDPEDGSQFQYRQETEVDEDGEFEMTVPYASTGHDEWGLAEGYTNTSVRPVNASAGYTLATDTTREGDNITQYVGSVHVTEGQVLGETESTSTVTLEERTSQLITIGGDDGSAGNGTVNVTAGTDGADGANGSGSPENGTETAGESTGSLRPVPAATVEAGRPTVEP